MAKFVITPQRFLDACTVTDYIGVVVGNMGAQMRVLPRMLVNAKGEYIITITHNEDGDPIFFENENEADMLISKIGIPRFEKLRKELTEAANSIVNPPKGESSTKPSPQ